MDCQTAAVILCAGMGSRLGLSEEQNKCAVSIRGTSPVQYGAASLLAAGAEHVIVVTGHARASIEQALLDEPWDGRLHLVHNPWYQRHGCNYSLACGMEAAAKLGARRVVIAEGDSLLHRASIRQLCSESSAAASLVRGIRYADSKKSVVAIGRGQRIFRYEYDPSHEGRLDGCQDGETLIGESMQLWSFSGAPLEALKRALMAYKHAADGSMEPMLHSGVYSINQFREGIVPVFSDRPEDWINLNTQQELRKAGVTEWVRKL